MSQICSKCGEVVQPGFKFCNVCGAAIEDQPDPGSRPPKAESYSELLGVAGRTMRILNGENAGRFVVIYPDCTIGRTGSEVDIADDPALSPVHFYIKATDDGAIITDCESLNGVFLRANDKVILRPNDIIRAGDHYFLYEYFPNDSLGSDFGAEFYATPSRGERFRLVEILEGGVRSRARCAADSIVVGRCEGDFVISDDMRMSPKHFTIRWTQRGGILVDHSDNGTFVQIHQDTPIQSGDIFFAGQTLFQVC